jgi:hypothetical protein
MWNSGNRDEWTIDDGAIGKTTVNGKFLPFSAVKF